MRARPKDDDEDLLYWVKRLSEPFYVSELITDDDPKRGTHAKTTAKLKRDGLLKQLRAAVVGGIGGHEGSLPGRERIPFDTGAMELYDAIERDISNRFVKATSHPVFLDLERTLGQWYIAFTNAHKRGDITDNGLMVATAVMKAWCTKIEAHFTKPKQLELTINVYARDEAGEIIRNADKSWRVAKRTPASCPVCGESYAHQMPSGDQVFALVLEYRELGADTINKATGLCRFCEQVWSAGAGLRELAWSIEQQETRRNEELSQTA